MLDKLLATVLFLFLKLQIGWHYETSLECTGNVTVYKQCFGYSNSSWVKQKNLLFQELMPFCWHINIDRWRQREYCQLSLSRTSLGPALSVRPRVVSNNRSKERKGQTLGVHLIEVSIKREYTVSLFAIQQFSLHVMRMHLMQKILLNSAKICRMGHEPHKLFSAVMQNSLTTTKPQTFP